MHGKTLNIEDATFLGERILVLAHPPHREPVIVENPSAGQSVGYNGVGPNGERNSLAAPVNYRTQVAFLDKCNQLRRLLG